jgi:hypothetical protein
LTPQFPLQVFIKGTARKMNTHDTEFGADVHHLQRESLLQMMRSLWRELPGLVSDRVQLLALEFRRAGQTLAMVIALGLAAVILLATAWLALWVGLAMALASTGLHWGWVCALIVLLNGGVACWAALHAKARLPLLALPATLRHLTLAPSTHPRGFKNEHSGTSADEAQVRH